MRLLPLLGIFLVALAWYLVLGAPKVREIERLEMAVIEAKAAPVDGKPDPKVVAEVAALREKLSAAERVRGLSAGNDGPIADFGARLKTEWAPILKKFPAVTVRLDRVLDPSEVVGEPVPAAWVSVTLSGPADQTFGVMEALLKAPRPAILDVTEVVNGKGNARFRVYYRAP